MWWFHLLVRRVDDLRQRVDVFERVVRAVGGTGTGPCRYQTGGGALPLLVRTFMLVRSMWCISYCGAILTIVAYSGERHRCVGGHVDS